MLIQWGSAPSPQYYMNTVDWKNQLLLVVYYVILYLTASKAIQPPSPSEFPGSLIPYSLSISIPSADAGWVFSGTTQWNNCTWKSVCSITGLNFHEKKPWGKPAFRLSHQQKYFSEKQWKLIASETFWSHGQPLQSQRWALNHRLKSVQFNSITLS